LPLAIRLQRWAKSYGSVECGRQVEMNVSRRLKKLEGLFKDTSGLIPHTQKWLEYWGRQVCLYMIDRAPKDQTRFPLEAFRAVLRNSDSPGSLVGSVSE
jgi:hypothetical protein